MVLDPSAVACGYLGRKLEDDDQLEGAYCQAGKEDGKPDRKEGLTQQALGHRGLPEEAIVAATPSKQGAQHEEAQPTPS